MRCVPEGKDANAEVEGDVERGAEDAALLVGLDLEPRRSPKFLWWPKRRGGGDDDVRLGPNVERCGPGGMRGGGGTQGDDAVGRRSGNGGAMWRARRRDGCGHGRDAMWGGSGWWLR